MSIYSAHNLAAEDEMQINNSHSPLPTQYNIMGGCSCHHQPLPINSQDLHNYPKDSLEDIILYPQTTGCSPDLITPLNPHLNNEAGEMDVEYMHSYWGEQRQQQHHQEQKQEQEQDQDQEQEQEKQRQRLSNLHFREISVQSSLNTTEQSYLNPPHRFITKVEMDSWPTAASNSGLISSSHAAVKQEHACTTLETANWLHNSSTSCSNPTLININTQLNSSSVNHPPSPMQKSSNFSFTTRWPIPQLPSLGIYPNPTPNNDLSINPQQEPPYYPPSHSMQWNHQQNMAFHNWKGAVDHPQESPTFKCPRVEVSITSPPKYSQLVKKVKLGDRIAALQQLVSPFGKTDTASVLLETFCYIKFLHSQVEVLTMPYFKSSTTATSRKESSMKIAISSSYLEKVNQESTGEKDSNQDLQSRGLCLVPMSSTMHITNEAGSSYWPP